MSRDYTPSPQRGVQLNSRPLPGVNYQEVAPPAPGNCGGAEAQSDLEATRVPFGPHKDKTLLQLLNDHPGYLLHLSQDAFTDQEDFELKVEEFCAKYQHRLQGVAGDRESSFLWAASLRAFRPDAKSSGPIVTGINFHEAVAVEALDRYQADALALAECFKRFPFPVYTSHAAEVANIPLAQLRRGLKAEQPGGAR